MEILFSYEKIWGFIGASVGPKFKPVSHEVGVSSRGSKGENGPDRASFA